MINIENSYNASTEEFVHYNNNNEPFKYLSNLNNEKIHTIQVHYSASTQALMILVLASVLIAVFIVSFLASHYSWQYSRNSQGASILKNVKNITTMDRDNNIHGSGIDVESAIQPSTSTLKEFAHNHGENFQCFFFVEAVCLENFVCCSVM